MRYRLSLLAATISICLALAGCSGGEPSDSQMKSAFVGLMRADGAVKSFSIHEFKKLACKAAGDRPGYVCDFFADATASLDLIGPQQIHGNLSGRFIVGQNNELEFIPERRG
jgi:hypothetical protein